MTKMTKNENNDSFMRDKNIMRAVDGKRKSHFAWPFPAVITYNCGGGPVYDKEFSKIFFFSSDDRCVEQPPTTGQDV